MTIDFLFPPSNTLFLGRKYVCNLLRILFFFTTLPKQNYTLLLQTFFVYKGSYFHTTLLLLRIVNQRLTF